MVFITWRRSRQRAPQISVRGTPGAHVTNEFIETDEIGFQDTRCE